ncbi:MAG TPA: hypothetical protein VI172_02805 [Candidatus Dormibacteraeota bacterium]|jgi:hypothetical protein
MILALLLTVTALTPGVITVIRLRARGWPIAVLAGLGVTLSIPFVALSCILLFPPLGLAVGILAVVAALNAYDAGRIWTATTWATIAVVALGCAGWSL